MNKNKKTLLIVGIAVAAIAICLAVFLLPNNESGNGELSWQEQYDLGVRYLSEGNYEEAIIAFTAAIEIDPKKPDTYEKLADVYIALGDIDKAKDIFEQGADATGDDSLRQRLDVLSQKGIVVISDNLDISDLSCYFVADHEIVEYAEDAIGGMNIDFLVNGPSDVRKVLISNWYPFLPDREQLADDIANEVEIWKQSEFAENYRNPPFDEGHAHPVYEEDLGGTFYVVLVGVDENFDFVGYAIVQEIIGDDGAAGNLPTNEQDISESLLEKNASENMIDIEDITFCGYKVSIMDFNALTAADYISVMKNEGFSEGTENVDVAEWWTVRRWQDYEEKWGKYTGFGNASVSVESDSDVIDFGISCSGTYYGEKQLSIGIKDICIGSSVEEVLSNLGFENSAEISEKFHKVVSETRSIGDDAVEDALDTMLQYSGDIFRTGNVSV